MAKEAWIVVANLQHGGAGLNLPYKNQTEAEGVVNNENNTARVVKLEAGSAAEAAKSVRQAFGQGLNTGKLLVAKSSSFTEVS